MQEKTGRLNSGTVKENVGCRSKRKVKYRCKTPMAEKGEAVAEKSEM
jgi:hypothetical protein